MSTYASVAQFVRFARRANHLHIMALRLGYATADSQYVEARDLHMCIARQIKASK